MSSESSVFKYQDLNGQEVVVGGYIYIYDTLEFPLHRNPLPPADHFTNCIITGYLLIPHFQETEIFESTFLSCLPHSIR